VTEREPSLRHYQVLSGEIQLGGGYLEPPDWGQCWNWYLAKNKADARQQAVKDPAFKEWVRDMRADGKPPFTGLEVSLTVCEHGVCWGCGSTCLDCEHGFTLAEMISGLADVRDDLAA
jgi:hypothetical protein